MTGHAASLFALPTEAMGWRTSRGDARRRRGADDPMRTIHESTVNSARQEQRAGRDPGQGQASGQQGQDGSFRERASASATGWPRFSGEAKQRQLSGSAVPPAHERSKE